MGTCYFGNRPSEKLVGKWADNKYIDLTINEDGDIIYNKQTEHTNVNYTGPGRFRDKGFTFCCCCCCLRGVYTEEDGSEPKLITNGIVLTKK